MEKFKKFVEGHLFQNLILAVIIINSAVLGLQTVPSLSEGTAGNILSVIDYICLGIFILEMLLKMVSALKPLQVIIGAIGKSLPGITWTALLLIIIYYIFSIIGVTQFGTAFPDWFGTIPKAMYTLFQVMTLESWSMGISRPVMEVFSYAWAYFVPFVLISSFVMMNVVVGVVVNAISEVSEMRKKDAESEESSDAAEKTEVPATINPDEIRAEIKEVREHLEKLESLLDK